MKYNATRLWVIAALLGFPLMVQAASYSSQLTFQADDQSMWASGDAWQLNWRQDIPLYDWDFAFETPKAGGWVGLTAFDQYSLYGRTAGNVGVSPYVSIDSGSVDISYDLRVDVQAPDAYTIRAGEPFTLSTAYQSQGTGSYTTNFPEIKAGVDLLFELQASAGLNTYGKYGCGLLGLGTCWRSTPSSVEIVGLDIDPVTGISANALGIPIGPFDAGLIYEDGRIPGFQFHNDSISILGGDEIDLLEEWSLGGYASIALNVPDIDTTGTEATGFTSTGSDDLFRLSIDADKIAGDIIDKAIAAAIAAGTAGVGSGALAVDLPDLEGSTNLEPIIGKTLAALIPIELSYNILDIEPFIDLDVAQTFTFTPDDLMVSFDLGNGDVTAPVKVGDDITLTMPVGGLDITPVYSLPDNQFSNLTQLAIDLGIDLTVLDFGLDFSGILGLIPDIDPPALFHEDLTMTEILNTFGIPSDWMSPAIFDRQFALGLGSIRADSFEVLAYRGNGGGGQAVPEPGSLFLLGLGLLLLAGLKGRGGRVRG